MIYECIYFYDELDLLDLRFHELYDVVDKFVICEYRQSVDGKPQPLFFADNKERFAPFLDKVIHIAVEQENNYNGYPLYLLRKRRDFARALQGCEPNDIVISTDPDIILKKSAVEQLKNIDMSTSNTQLISDWYIYYMDSHYIHYKFDQSGACWYRNVIPGFWETVGAGIRIGQSIDNAGWHFAKLGGVDKVIGNIAHGYPLRWLNNPVIVNKEVMQERMENGYAWDDHFSGYAPKQKVMEITPYDPVNYPDYVNQHPEIYSQYFKDGMTIERSENGH